MARLSVTPQIASSTAAAPTPVGSTVDGHKFANKGDVVILLVNGTGSSANVTLITGKTVDGLAVADKVVAVPANSSRVVGHLDKGVYNQPSGADEGTVYVDFGTVDVAITATYLK